MHSGNATDLVDVASVFFDIHKLGVAGNHHGGLAAVKEDTNGHHMVIVLQVDSTLKHRRTIGIVGAVTLDVNEINGMSDVDDLCRIIYIGFGMGRPSGTYAAGLDELVLSKTLAAQEPGNIGLYQSIGNFLMLGAFGNLKALDLAEEVFSVHNKGNKALSQVNNSGILVADAYQEGLNSQLKALIFFDNAVNGGILLALEGEGMLFITVTKDEFFISQFVVMGKSVLGNAILIAIVSPSAPP